VVKIGINLYGMESWFDGDFAAVVELMKVAEDAGIDEVGVAEHVVMGENLQNYPYGKYQPDLLTPWFEPIAVLSAVAAVTRRIRLSTGILIAPLRPAVLLAKQLATLDILSRGRLTIGVGTGWQKEEYDAAGVPWEGRYTRLDEQLRVCRQLWSESPATFKGKTVNYERIHARPFPVQPGGIPVWFGIAPTERNFKRIAESGDGWIPMEKDPAVLKGDIDKLKAAFTRAGRDPASAGIKVSGAVLFGSDGKPDLEKSLATVPALAEVGVTCVEFAPLAFCRPDGFGAFCARAARAKGG
jgi:probable F420-dependent oxidoreductase